MDSRELTKLVRRLIHVNPKTRMKLKFLGCRPINKLPNNLPKNTCLIVNSDVYGSRGEHWVLLLNFHGVCFFDSFALPPAFYSPKLDTILTKSSHRVWRANRIVQSLTSRTCGQHIFFFLATKLNSQLSCDSIFSKYSRSTRRNDTLVRDFVKLMRNILL